MATEITTPYQSKYLHEKGFKSDDLYTIIQYCCVCNVEVNRHTSKSEITRKVADIFEDNFPVSLCISCTSMVLEPLNAFNQMRPKLMDIIKNLASRQSEGRGTSYVASDLGAIKK
ncbi:MAG: hypothetical protein P0116_11635 [Candidatus Nitrosocosmicus sp.]|nr:hypothetical protein [Candidatus Nitrosocosmicus sp.]